MKNRVKEGKFHRVEDVRRPLYYDRNLCIQRGGTLQKPGGWSCLISLGINVLGNQIEMIKLKAKKTEEDQVNFWEESQQ